MKTFHLKFPGIVLIIYELGCTLNPLGTIIEPLLATHKSRAQNSSEALSLA